MNKAEIFEFINANPICHLATVEGDAPRVRDMGLFEADDRGILIQLVSVKDTYQQLVENPKVELCFFNLKTLTQIRISGTAEFLEDKTIKEEALTVRPFLLPMVEAHGIEVIKVFRIAQARAYMRTQATNFDPKEYISL